MDTQNAIIVFQGRNIRRVWHEEHWWFVIEDLVAVLTDSRDPKQYLNKMRRRDPVLSEGWVRIVHTLPVPTVGGVQKMRCVNTEGAFRIIQSIPSSKAEPFKLWLASVGYDRIREIENPERAQQRMKELYRAKGYAEDWVEKRVRGIAVRAELTEEWEKRGIRTNKDYSILTAEISRATFGMTPSEYQAYKGLKNENLRDHMDDMELILTMLGEATTTRFTRERDSRQFSSLKKDAKDGGDVAGMTRRNIEQQLGKSVVTSKNYLDEPQKRKSISKR